VQEHLYHCQNAHLAQNTLTATINDEHLQRDCIYHEHSLYLFGQEQMVYGLYDPGRDCELQPQAAGHLRAPMPGAVIAVNVKQGDQIKLGEALMILEAMKMEHTIKAPFSGTVTEVHFPLGAMVNEGDELLVMEPTE
jgi:3-methylcrotonyl-CoA carboxylase alpha subunit